MVGKQLYTSCVACNCTQRGSTSAAIQSAADQQRSSFRFVLLTFMNLSKTLYERVLVSVSGRVRQVKPYSAVGSSLFWYSSLYFLNSFCFAFAAMAAHAQMDVRALMPS